PGRTVPCRRGGGAAAELVDSGAFRARARRCAAIDERRPAPAADDRRRYEPVRGVFRGGHRDPRHVCSERSGGGPVSTESREPSEEELRAAYEAELKRLRVEHVLLDNIAALANLGMRRTGLAPGTENERDPEQVRLAIESLRALLPVL